MLGDVEQHAFRAKEFLLEIAGLVSILALVDVVRGAEALELLRELVDILDQHAEMMDAAELHALAELVGLEFEDRHVERAVAQKHAVGEIAVRPADFLEIERLLVEFGHRLRVLGGDRDMAQLRHVALRQLALSLSVARPPGETEAPVAASRGIPARIGAIALPTRATASFFSKS